MTTHMTPYLNFPGTTREAFTYYRGVFGGEATFKTMAETDMPCEEMGVSPDAIAHAQLQAPNVFLCASDAIEPDKIQLKSDTYSISFLTDEADWAKEKFEALTADGQVEMPMEKMEWGDVFGSAIDRYGVRWMFNITEKQA